MRVYLAAFDQAHKGPSGNYWAWRHPQIPQFVLDEFYYKVGTHHLQKVHDDVSNGPDVGGGAALDQDWLCWYRFLAGGDDTGGRPGRVVILCGFTGRSHETTGHVSSLLTSDLFELLSREARHQSPLQPPSSLEIEVVAVRDHGAVDGLTRLKAGERVAWNGGGSLGKCAGLVSALPHDQLWQCEILFQPDGGEAIAWLRKGPSAPQVTRVEDGGGNAQPMIQKSEASGSQKGVSTSDRGSGYTSSPDRPSVVSISKFRLRFWILAAFLSGFVLAWVLKSKCDRHHFPDWPHLF